jgi:hypothetical protein
MCYGCARANQKYQPFTDLGVNFKLKTEKYYDVRLYGTKISYLKYHLDSWYCGTIRYTMTGEQLQTIVDKLNELNNGY